ncbi:MAG: hypothetical protein KC518_10795 [Candidatus Cloacimonetes bacterium]|nr:hypothetical protein [Candidatus Cloacimonadota bacterium]
MKRPIWLRILLWVLYSATIASGTWLALRGWSYYMLPDELRPRHPMHELWRPAGFLGHGIGILGTLLMILMLLYIPRKRLDFMQSWGDIRHWLDIHIWLGITGTLLVSFHTAFIVGGIVSISFWSMVAVALSGVLGRYLYLQIPRGIDGHELNRQDLERQLGESLSALPDGAALLARYSPQEEGGLFQWVIDDLKRLFKMRHFQSDLVRSGHDLAEARRLLVILRTALRLRRRIRRLEQVRALLHHWHVIHRPFAFVMYVILVIHVVVAVLFGFTWI